MDYNNIYNKLIANALARKKISLAQKGKPRGKRSYKEDGTWIIVKEGN